ncbi:extracellular solute-binding protein [Eleftheria terrae]|uniref:extracellular solute-binding protein n=1 Tax=Eleftheria terrae TaxID=1597781 RepID=UPI00263ABA2E|nr:extracellular solute-binding protein [Eleftheria terrae]WKB55843.1 extracellular solute-binding protein [Eleftheria terrae]
MKTKAMLAAVAAVAAMAQAQATRLTIWLVGDDKGPQILQPAVEAFKRRHAGVEVEVRAIPWSDAMTKYSAALASKKGPDILTGGLSYGMELGTKGGLLDLAKKAPDLVKTVQQSGHPGIVRATATAPAVFALPYDLTVQLQFYRTDKVARPPSTWDELRDEVQRQQAAGNRGYAQQWGNMGWVGFFPYLKQAGGALYDAACTRSVVDSPEAVQALQYYASLYTRFKLPTDTWPDVESGLENGTHPVVQSGSWMFASLDVSRKKIAGKWAASKLPAGPSGRSTALVGGTVIGVTTISPQPDLAVDFVRTIYDSETTRQMMTAAAKRGFLWLPGGRHDLIASADLPPERKKPLLEQLADAEGPPTCKGWERSDDTLTRAVQQVVLSGADPKAALGEAAQRLTRELAR